MDSNEKKHNFLVFRIVRDIMSQINDFNLSKERKLEIDLPLTKDYYYTPIVYGERYSFYVELYLYKTNKEDYKIDADSPGSLDEDEITVAIYYNPNNFTSQINEIRNNLIYTIRHEYEHFLQVISDDERVSYPHSHKYKTDSLKNLLKKREIEPQVRGYFLQSIKEKKPMDLVIKDHLDKLERNKQINFLDSDRKNIVINTLVNYARAIGLPVKTSHL